MKTKTVLSVLFVAWVHFDVILLFGLISTANQGALSYSS